MRNEPDRALALECLRLASAYACCSDPEPIIDAAGKYFVFVTGSDTDDAKRKLDAVRVAVSQP